MMGAIVPAIKSMEERVSALETSSQLLGVNEGQSTEEQHLRVKSIDKHVSKALRQKITSQAFVEMHKLLPHQPGRQEMEDKLSIFETSSEVVIKKRPQNRTKSLSFEDWCQA